VRTAHRLPDVPTDLTRRDALRLGFVVSAAAGLGACTTSAPRAPTPTDPGGPQDPDRALRAEIGRDEARLSALYVAAAGVLAGSVAARVTELGTRHDAYRRAVDPAGLASASAQPSGSSGTTGSPSPSSAAGPPPVTAATALVVLTAAESAAAAARAAQTSSAVDPDLARIVALVGAGEASAAAALASAGAR